MKKLYKSEHFALVDIRPTGKKKTNGILCFQGLPSVFGNSTAVCAVEEGRVIIAGRNNDVKSRSHRVGTAVCVMSKNGMCITYGRLSHRSVNVGDYVYSGQVIGYEGNTGSGTERYLLLEFRRNGRRVDGCEYLGIRPKPTVFSPEQVELPEVVCRACGFSGTIREYLSKCPEAEDMWRMIYNKLMTVD